jgi:hypothetical protein
MLHIFNFIYWIQYHFKNIYIYKRISDTKIQLHACSAILEKGSSMCRLVLKDYPASNSKVFILLQSPNSSFIYITN